MTILAAMHDPGMQCTWIGSDTFAQMGQVKFICGPKWIIGDYWALGCAGDGRLGNIVQAKFMDELISANDAFTVVDKLRLMLKDDGWNTNTDPGAPDFGVWAMLASSEGVWSICTAFSVDRMDGYWADGSGGQIAMGAMHAMKGQEKAPAAIVQAGIAAAIQHERSCGGEIWMDSLPAQKIRAAAE